MRLSHTQRLPNAFSWRESVQTLLLIKSLNRDQNSIHHLYFVCCLMSKRWREICITKNMNYIQDNRHISNRLGDECISTMSMPRANLWPIKKYIYWIGQKHTFIHILGDTRENPMAHCTIPRLRDKYVANRPIRKEKKNRHFHCV